MGKEPSVQISIHHPETEEGRLALAERAADIHADYVAASVRKLTCPDRQKQALMQAVMDTVRDRCKAKGQP